MGATSSDYSEWNADEKWSSQEWKSDELLDVRTGRLVVLPHGLFTQHTDRFIDDNDMDSDIVERIRRVVKNPDHSCTGWMIECEGSNERSLIWWMFVFDIRSICIHGKKLLRKLKLSKKKKKQREKIPQWNRCSTYLKKLIVGQLDKIYGVSPIIWEDFPWKH